MREIVKESFRTIDQLSQSKDVVSGLATGFVDIDEMTSGLQKGDLVIVAARPGMGKTALATNIAVNAARARLNDPSEGACVAFFSLEMSAEQLATRVISEVSEIPLWEIRKGRVMHPNAWSQAPMWATNHIVGNVVITNSENRARFFIDGHAPILREKDILTPETADTPAKLVYLAVQLMYLSPDPMAHHPTYFSLVRDILTTMPSAWPRSIVYETPSTAWTTPSSVSNDTVRLRTSSSGAISCTGRVDRGRRRRCRPPGPEPRPGAGP